MDPSEEKENFNLPNNPTENDSLVKKRVHPTSNLSASESEEEEDRKKTKTSQDDFVKSKETFSLPTIKIQPILGGKVLSFPVHPRLTLIDLKDFILFTLNIPHPQQILSFCDESNGKIILLSNFSENALLCSVPGLIDEVTGRCAPVSLSFKMSSGMDFSIHPSDIEYESSNATDSNSGEYFSEEGFFEISSDTKEENKKLSDLAASLASIIPLPPGVSKSSRMLFRSLSKSSPTNNNLPTLWEIFFPESGVKMMVTALINVSEVKGDSGEGTDKENSTDMENRLENSNDTLVNTAETINTDNIIMDTASDMVKPIAPVLLITSEPESVQESDSSPILTDVVSNEPKNHCEKCRIRCRPALRFICKCNKTFCQSHRYPDQHSCTYDHRAEGLASIQANNPKIVKDKVSNF